MAESKARFTKYLNPVLHALRSLGGSGRPGEVCDWVAEHLGIEDDKRAGENPSGGSKFDNDVAWARFYLVRAGYLDSSVRGVWSLTEQGRTAAELSPDDIVSIIRRVQAQSASTAESVSATDEELESAVQAEADQRSPESEKKGYRERVLDVLRALPPGGFERLCQRLLRESGFQKVQVTGRTGDGGIDGIGILQLNPFVSFRVLFQCKRYAGSVGSGHLRDFRGAMTGRTDKGLILTTGSFSADAQTEATRDGAPPIELVDGQGIVNLMEQLELGLLRRTTYDVDVAFFEEFKQ